MNIRVTFGGSKKGSKQDISYPKGKVQNAHNNKRPNISTLVFCLKSRKFISTAPRCPRLIRGRSRKWQTHNTVTVGKFRRLGFFFLKTAAELCRRALVRDVDKKKGRPPAGGKESAQSKAEAKRTKNLKKRGLDWKEGEMEMISWGLDGSIGDMKIVEDGKEYMIKEVNSLTTMGALITKEADSMRWDFTRTEGLRKEGNTKDTGRQSNLALFTHVKVGAGTKNWSMPCTVGRAGIWIS